MSNLSEIEQIFKPPASGVTLVITVGNSFRSDDGVGPYIAGGVSSPQNHILIINAGNRPENVIDDAIVIAPKRTIIIDAADFNGIPGEMRLIPESAVPDVIHSTHSFPLNIVTRLIAEDTGSEIYFLGIQHKSMSLGEELSAEVRESAENIISIISDPQR